MNCSYSIIGEYTCSQNNNVSRCIDKFSNSTSSYTPASHDPVRVSHHLQNNGKMGCYTQYPRYLGKYCYSMDCSKTTTNYPNGKIYNLSNNKCQEKCSNGYSINGSKCIKSTGK